MDKIELVKETFSFKNPGAAEANLADDFQATDSAGGQPLDKASWIGMGQLMQAAIPDIDYIVEEIGEEGEDVRVVGRFTGTFTNDFDMSAMGMGVIPATGETVNFPTSTNILSFSGDQISKSHSPDTGPDAGLAGFMKALGAEMG